MKIKTCDATPPQLNWLVAQIEDFDNGDWLPDYSTDWNHGGTIIEREIARLEDLGDEGWEACGYGFTATGPTPLVAAMRCFVSSKLGDEVDVPEELV